MTQRVVEYWVTCGRLDGSEPGDEIMVFAGMHWKQARDMAGDPDVFCIERVVRTVCDSLGVLDMEYEDVWVRSRTDEEVEA